MQLKEKRSRRNVGNRVVLCNVMNIIRCVSENWIVKNSPILKRQWGWFWASFRVRLASFSLNRVFNTDLLYSTTKLVHVDVSMSSFFAQVRLFRRKIKNFRVHYLRIQFVWAADAVSSKVSEGRFNEDKLQVNELPKLFAEKSHFFRTSRCFLHFKEFWFVNKRSQRFVCKTKVWKTLNRSTQHEKNSRAVACWRPRDANGKEREREREREKERERGEPSSASWEGKEREKTRVSDLWLNVAALSDESRGANEQQGQLCFAGKRYHRRRGVAATVENAS